MAPPAFTLEDLRRQLRQISKLGAIGEILKMIPGLSGLAERLGSIDPEHELRVIDAIINSMTPAERARPDLIDTARRQRVACGSGTRPEDVDKLLDDFRAMRELMQTFAGMSMQQRWQLRHRRDDTEGFADFELN